MLVGLLFTAPVPLTLANTGDLQILNLSDVTFDFTTDQLLAMPKTFTESDFWCYTELVTTGTWGGVALTELLSHINSTSEVVSLQFFASDGYAVSIPIELARQDNVIIAYEQDGQPLNEGLRLVLPGYNGAAWISSIEKIEFSEENSNYPDYNGVYDEIVDSLREETNILREQNKPTTTPSPTPEKLQATTQPTSTPSIQADNKANLTQQPSPTSLTPTIAVDSSLENLSVYLTLVVALLLLTALIIVSLIHKRKSNP